MDWQNASFLNNIIVYLTAEELRGVSEEFVAIVARHNERVDPSKRPEGALSVRVTAFGHPLPPTESGN